MLADITTRKGATLEDINQDSVWINGADWIKQDEKNVRLQTVSHIVLFNV